MTVYATNHLWIQCHIVRGIVASKGTWDYNHGQVNRYYRGMRSRTNQTMKNLQFVSGATDRLGLACAAATDNRYQVADWRALNPHHAIVGGEDDSEDRRE
jgi:hypothetical protein